ncbi:hypothetical protein [Vibrio parahaemolyticus]|nr:hypothetical protein [Vibrio parahaemolyticus]
MTDHYLAIKANEATLEPGIYKCLSGSGIWGKQCLFADYTEPMAKDFFK